jgi:lincosamide nucleotidyltransferase A/C/D/E
MRMTMTAADVVEILGWLGTASVDVWLDGGWGVDALVGEQTREHNDLDLIVRDAPARGGDGSCSDAGRIWPVCAWAGAYTTQR